MKLDSWLLNIYIKHQLWAHLCLVHILPACSSWFGQYVQAIKHNSCSVIIYIWFQEYVIRVQRGPVPENNWTVSRRYNHFAWLDSELRVSGIELPLPPKKILGKMEREFIAERQRALQVMLPGLLDFQPHTACTVLAASFLIYMYTGNMATCLTRIFLPHWWGLWHQKELCA